MSERKEQGRPDSSPEELETRVRLLESRMDAAIEAVRLLARGLEEGPLTEPGGRAVADAARRAHELLLVTESMTKPATRSATSR